MGLREVKKELQKQTKEELLKHIATLYKKYKPVKEYFDFQVNPDEKELLIKYKKEIDKGFYTRGGNPDLKLSVSRKAVNSFKKLGTSPKSMIDLLLYRVECGVEFTLSFGDIDDQFYESIENTYHEALELMSDKNLLDHFKIRAGKIVTDTSEIGWGFHDYLDELFRKYYGYSVDSGIIIIESH